MIRGSCHCGNIRFELDGDDTRTIASRACGCSFCRKHNAAWASRPGRTVTLHKRDAERVGKYRFGTETADFLVCRDCGVVPIVISEIDEESYCVVNVRCFDDVDAGRIVESSTDFDGEDTDQRLARRKRNWSRVILGDD